MPRAPTRPLNDAADGLASDPLSGDDNPSNVLSILIATDNHLGYLEKDPVRPNDSFRAFEEVLQLAKIHDVDFVLLRGDLFHENKPSRNAMYTAMSLLRKYCMGDKPCRLEFLSDQSVNLPGRHFSIVNFQDPNLNISLPIFSIHGNHDDPFGDGNLAALDVLSVAGLVNYFGRADNVENITVTPLLMRKGTTQVAVYGIGNVRDERLYRTFVTGGVRCCDRGTTLTIGSICSCCIRIGKVVCFLKIAILALNRRPIRATHTAKGHIAPHFIDPFIHLVLWGHEHECRVDPEQQESGFFVTQPGSSVATSLCEGEAVSKHVALLKISGSSTFHLTPIRLKSVRPFVMDEIILGEVDEIVMAKPSAVKAKVQDVLEAKELIDQAKGEWDELHSDETKPPECPLPLIRLRVEYSSLASQNDKAGKFSAFNPQRFGARFVDRVANPKDVLQFYRKKQQAKKFDGQASRVNAPAPFLPDALDAVSIENIVLDHLKTSAQLTILPENELSDAVRAMVEKDDRSVIKEFVEQSLQRTREKMKDQQAAEEEDVELAAKKEKERYAEEYSKKDKSQRIRGKARERPAGRDDDRDDDGGEGHCGQEKEDDEEEEEQPQPKRGRGSRGGRGAGTTARGRGSRGGARGGRGASTAAAPKAKSRQKAVISDDDEDEEMEELPRRNYRDVDEDDDLRLMMELDEEEEEAPKPAKAAPTAAKRGNFAFGGSNMGQPMIPPPKLTKPTATGAPNTSDPSTTKPAPAGSGSKRALP
ncbi:DNA repair exonuclease [Gonapodya prolifera JEL478]|uniref:Double-strand break repair protein n=1 Tax=Gonapodya prolifera (strain JEL478) TaxID=1344416 RepID=A0A139A7K5_GONPJ|nr:DNA repair exonuclease [Gonapodya prolifera JEL478]|eukprot:KXS12353.1 DNA repair exonuclease [Gonapodya prolifera JEL478]